MQYTNRYATVDKSSFRSLGNEYKFDEMGSSSEMLLKGKVMVEGIFLTCRMSCTVSSFLLVLWEVLACI
jgi:hypothetical protein